MTTDDATATREPGPAEGSWPAPALPVGATGDDDWPFDPTVLVSLPSSVIPWDERATRGAGTLAPPFRARG